MVWHTEHVWRLTFLISLVFLTSCGLGRDLDFLGGDASPPNLNLETSRHDTLSLGFISYCFNVPVNGPDGDIESVCSDGTEPANKVEIPSVGSGDYVTIAFPLTAWSLSATYRLVDSTESCPLPLKRLKPGLYRANAPRADSEIVVAISGSGRDPKGEGDIYAAFRWLPTATTPSASITSSGDSNC